MRYRQYYNGGDVQLVHRILAAKALGKPLPKGAEVHHIDENKRNNAPSNLVICPNRAYHMLLHARQRVIDKGGDPNEEKICSSCGQAKALSAFYKDRASYDEKQGTCGDCQRRKLRKVFKVVAMVATPDAGAETGGVKGGGSPSQEDND